AVIEEPLHLRERRRPHGVIDIALTSVELDERHPLDTRRELGRDLFLAPTEDKGAYPIAEPRGGGGVARFDRGGVALYEIGAPAEEAGVREAHLAPELEEPV